MIEPISLLTSKELNYTSTIEDLENYIRQNFDYTDILPPLK